VLLLSKASKTLHALVRQVYPVIGDRKNPLAISRRLILRAIETESTENVKHVFRDMGLKFDLTTLQDACGSLLLYDRAHMYQTAVDIGLLTKSRSMNVAIEWIDEMEELYDDEQPNEYPQLPDFFSFLIKTGDLDRGFVHFQISHHRNIFIRQLIDRGLDWDKNFTIYTLRRENPKLVAYLLERKLGFHPDVLCAAAFYDDCKAFEALYKEGYTIPEDTFEMAAARGNLNVIKRAVELGASVPFYRCMVQAVISSHLDVVEYLHRTHGVEFNGRLVFLSSYPVSAYVEENIKPSAEW